MRLSVVALLLCLAATPASAEQQQLLECKGPLKMSSDGTLMVMVPPEGICAVNSTEVSKVISHCLLGRFCRVYGLTESCKDESECSEFTNILRVRPR